VKAALNSANRYNSVSLVARQITMSDAAGIGMTILFALLVIAGVWTAYIVFAAGSGRQNHKDHPRDAD
jgi:hypothetical protein